MDLEASLAPFEARPHWGKLFRARAATMAALDERLDPRGAFRNTWLDACVLEVRPVRPNFF